LPPVEPDASQVTVTGKEPDSGVTVKEATGMLGGKVEEIVKVRDAEPVPQALEAVTFTPYVPAEVGMPEIKPLAVLMDNPDGSPMAL
jgi:hypothetical protein